MAQSVKHRSLAFGSGRELGVDTGTRVWPCADHSPYAFLSFPHCVRVL